MNNTHYGGPDADLGRRASAHITQWKDRTESAPSPFISASFSIAYALFEARRWNARYWCNNTQISVIDTKKITSDAWIATELVGAWYNTDMFFARWSEEALVYGCIPQDAVVVTAPLETFFACLPRWCSDVTVQIRSRKILRSTEAVAGELAEAAENPANNTPDEQAQLLEQSVNRSIHMLRGILPPMRTYNKHIHADAVDKIARLAAIFCWWPKWITRTDPLAYPSLLKTVEEEVLAAGEVASRKNYGMYVQQPDSEWDERGAEAKSCSAHKEYDLAFLVTILDCAKSLGRLTTQP
ncbi:hypothetical protein DFH09DRAFT_1414541 [Mycena vulgaris]|nr:hypothetical protein DFH09DRAFT_1414541 [Mycena vulgaris]